MSNLVEQAKFDGVSLVGFRLNPDSEMPDFYTLLLYGEADVALTVNNDQIGRAHV